MTFVRALLPILVMMVMVLLAVFPWGLALDTRHVLPLLPALAILVMNLRRMHAVPEWAAFAAGLVLDALSAGPLGFWALIYLAAYALAALLHPFRGRGIAQGWINVIAALALLAALQWALISLYGMSAAPLAPVMHATGLALLVYPLLEVMLAPFAMAPQTRDNGYLVRGG